MKDSKRDGTIVLVAGEKCNSSMHEFRKKCAEVLSVIGDRSKAVDRKDIIGVLGNAVRITREYESQKEGKFEEFPYVSRILSSHLASITDKQQKVSVIENFISYLEYHKRIAKLSELETHHAFNATMPQNLVSRLEKAEGKEKAALIEEWHQALKYRRSLWADYFNGLMDDKPAVLPDRTVSVQKVVEVLNRAVMADPAAMQSLIEERVKCGATLAADKTIQVGVTKDEEDDTTCCEFGALGLINGIMGVDENGWGTIAAVYEIVCPNGHEVDEKATVNDECPSCGEHLQWGRLAKFVDLGKNVSHETGEE